MYFEPSKKTCYRFPSAQSITKLDNRMYFPEKPSYADEDTRFENRNLGHVPERETYYDI